MPTINTTDLGANSAVFEYTAAFDLQELITAFTAKMVVYGWTEDLVESTLTEKYYNCNTKGGDGTYKKGLRITFAQSGITAYLSELIAGVYENEITEFVHSSLADASGGYLYLFAGAHYFYTAADGNDQTFQGGQKGFFEFERDDNTVESATDTHRWGAVNFHNLLTRSSFHNRSTSYAGAPSAYTFMAPSSCSYQGVKTIEPHDMHKFQSATTNLFAWGCAIGGGRQSATNKSSSSASYTYPYAYGSTFATAPIFFPKNYALEPSLVVYSAYQQTVNTSYNCVPREMMLFGRPIGLKMVKDVQLRNVTKIPVTDHMLDSGGTLTDHFVISVPVSKTIGMASNEASNSDAVTHTVGFALPM